MVELLSEVISFWKQHPIMMTVNVIMCAIWPLSDLIIPLISGSIVTAVQQGDPFIGKLIALVASFLVFNVMFMLMTYHDALVIPRLQNFIRSRMLHRLLAKYQKNFHELPTGEIVSKSARIPMTAVYIVDHIKNTFLPYIVTLVTSSLYICAIDSTIGLSMLVSVLFVMYTIITTPKTCAGPGQYQEKLHTDIHEQTEDTMRNLLSVYAADTMKEELDRIGTYEDKYNAAFMSTTTCVMKQRTWCLSGMVFMLLVFVWQCYKSLTAGCLTSGQFVTILMIMMNVCSALTWQLSIITDVAMEWNTLGSPQDGNTIHSLAESDDHDLTRDLTGVSKVTFEHVTYSVPTRTRPIIQNLSLTVEEGQKVAFVGHIGSGKSTLMKLLMRFQDADAGRILLGHTDIKHMNLRQLRRRVGYVSQHPVLFDRTIFENLVYGSVHHGATGDAKRAVEERINVILDRLGLSDAFADLQGGVDARAGKNGNNLSGGQRQIVQCIRTLLWDPEVVILDEVTASVDPVTKSKLLRLIKSIMQTRTTLMITHDSTMLELADRVITMHSGRIIQDVLMKNVS